jgi:hypothetical protein
MLCFDILLLKMSFDEGMVVVFVDYSRWLTRANMMYRLEHATTVGI